MKSLYNDKNFRLFLADNSYVMYCKPIQGTRPLAIKDDLIKFNDNSSHGVEKQEEPQPDRSSRVRHDSLQQTHGIH
ncbi:unnamed protein product [Hermetia illucens]|uniref:Uncharacterized protein n=1 Tax=Hermetia illucens TaxID=343691 RepID=A0A7R8UNR8_HERIL|nr:unnamed protein product [Hermetia illucens]